MALAAALTALALAPGTGSAQGPPRYVGGGGGWVRPVGTFGDVDNAGWHVLVTAAQGLTGSLGLGIDATYGQTTHENDAGKSAFAGAIANLTLFVGGEGRRIRPFLFAGAGAFRVEVTVPAFGSATATKPAFNAGVGVLIGSRGRRAFVTARYLTVRTAPQPTSFVPISAGVVVPVGAPTR